jgi:metallo-beta-lactamase family protein
VKLTFLGATNTVTGSKYLVSSERTRVLVDCGLFQGLKRLRLRNREPFPVPPAELEAVVLTHAHLDHSGYLPLLVRNGFRGPVFCTPATKALCEILLPDSGHLQEEDAAYANRHGFSRHHPALPLYTRADAERSLHQLEPIPFLDSVELEGGLGFAFHRAGHILGSAMIHLSGPEGTTLFTGDLGRLEDPLLLPPADPVEPADAALVESTYGDRLHPPTDPADTLAEAIVATAARGGCVIIPAFAVGRTQSLLVLVHRLKSAGRIPDIPIYLDSPMAVRATKVFRQFAEESHLTDSECEAVCTTATYVTEVADSMKLDRMNMPRVIISASGMATGGRVLHHLKALAPDHRNMILFVGHQAAGTRGAAIVGGAGTVKIHGEHVPVRAGTAVIENMSAHMDQREMLTWLKRFSTPPSRLFITHGEPVPADTLRQRVEEELGWECSVPEYGEEAVIGSRTRPQLASAD